MDIKEKYLELTTKGPKGHKILINVDQIVSIEPWGEGTALALGFLTPGLTDANYGLAKIEVVEKYDEVRRLLYNHVINYY